MVRNRVFLRKSFAVTRRLDKKPGFFGLMRPGLFKLAAKPRGFCCTVKVCGRIEEGTINPTDEQAQACLRVCQMLSNFYKDIQLFRFNPRNREVYIFAGEELQIRVFPSGDWSFIDETEL